MKRYQGFKLAVGLLIGISTIQSLSGCSPEPERSSDTRTTVNSCSLPEDQADTILGRWPVAPILLSFQRDSQFSAGEREAIVRAAQVWNDFYVQSNGFALFQISTVDHEGYEYQCANGESIYADDGRFQVPVIMRKVTSGLENSRSIIATTSTCLVEVEQKLRVIRAAKVDLNYQFFFVGGRPVPDLISTVVHEFGHLVGLDHSCEFSPESIRPGMPDCQAISNRTYFTAAMFPTSDGTIVRTQLNNNDQSRANCLYDDEFIR